MERIESKKQLEAKFQDIQRKIQANRDFTRAETKRLHDTLIAFRNRFETNLRQLKDEFETKIRLMREENRAEFKKVDERLDHVEQSIYKEISDRVSETDQTIALTQTRSTSKFISLSFSLITTILFQRFRTRLILRLKRGLLGRRTLCKRSTTLSTNCTRRQTRNEPEKVYPSANSKMQH